MYILRRLIVSIYICTAVLTCTSDIQTPYITPAEEIETQLPHGVNVQAYWLYMPAYNDFTLIQLSPGAVQKGQQPRLNASGQPVNFRYVDPTSTDPNSGFNKVSAGLFYWKSDYRNNTQARGGQFAQNARVVRPEPNGNEYARLRNQAYAPVIRAQGSAPRAGQQSWKPQNIVPQKQNMQVLTQQPQQQQLILDVVTCNTLAEEPYNRYKQVQAMPIQQRSNLFKNAQQNTQYFANADIICLQEWDQNLAKGFKGYGYIGEQVHNSPNRTFTTAVFYQKGKWDIEHTTTLNYAGKTQRIVTFIEPNTCKRLTVASCHIPSTAALRNMNTSQEVIINTVKRTAENQARYHGNPIIIAGDFNYNTYAGAIANLPARDNTPRNYNTLSNALNGYTDLAAQHNAAKKPTAYDKGYTRMDYMWINSNGTNFQSTGYTMQPQNLWDLIKHTNPQQDVAMNKPLFNGYFSDHTLLRGTFTY